MGKAGGGGDDAAQVGAPTAAPLTGRYGTAVGRALTGRCAVVLLLAAGVSLSAFFLLLHLRASGIIPHHPATFGGDIQASFILLKARSELASHATKLEKEINSEIGVPNSQVSVSMHTFKRKYFTYVKFDIFSYPRNTSISETSMGTLRKNLIELTLQQQNLHLTPSIFGDVFCLEMLGFPGGITMALPRYNSTIDVQLIFNFTLDMSIHQIRKCAHEMKTELLSILKQMSNEDLLIDLTNKNGSTVTPPVTVQVFISSDDHSIYQLRYRLKQIAEIITEPSSKNLGLNPSVFGRIRDLKLFPLLQTFVSHNPNLSPVPIPSPSSPPCSQPTTDYSQENFVCPDLLKKLDTTFPHRKLMQLSPMKTSQWVPTQSHIGNTHGGKKIQHWIGSNNFC